MFFLSHNRIYFCVLQDKYGLQCCHPRQMTSKVHRYQVHLLSTVHNTCSVLVFYIFFDLSDGILVTMWSSVHVLETASCKNAGKAAYIRPKVVGPFLGPCASRSYVHWAALLSDGILIVYIWSFTMMP
jgi:hypothetical protein